MKSIKIKLFIFGILLSRLDFICVKFSIAHAKLTTNFPTDIGRFDVHAFCDACLFQTLFSKFVAFQRTTTLATGEKKMQN